VGDLLHGHALVHVRRDCLPVVKRWRIGFDERRAKPREQAQSVNLHARPTIESDLGYALKQRQFNGPFEHQGQFPRESPETLNLLKFQLNQTDRFVSSSFSTRVPTIPANPASCWMRDARPPARPLGLSRCRRWSPSERQVTNEGSLLQSRPRTDERCGALRE
jgi:hypothetical protein